MVKLTYVFSQLCHVCVTFSTGALRGGLIRWGRGGTIATDGRRRHKLPMRTPKRRGPLPPWGGPITAG